jgi:hypothetical protein
MESLCRFLFGSAFILFGLIWIIPAQKTTFYCQRMEGKQPPCQLTVSRITGSETTSISLEKLRRAKIKPSSAGGTYRIVFVTETGEISASHADDSIYRSKQEFIAQVNQFITNKEMDVVEAKEDSRWIFFSFGTILILPGIVAILNLIPIVDSEESL